MYMGRGSSPPGPGVGGLSRKRYTQYVEHNRKGRLQEQEKAGRGPTQWRDAVCYGAEKC
jgi:hypothetical protein